MSRDTDGLQALIVPGGTRHRLPPRGGRGVRVAGAVLTGFGLVTTGFMVFWMSGPIRAAFSVSSSIRWFLLAFGLLGVFGLVPALGMLVLGLGLLSGRSRCEVEVSGGRLALIEYAGPLRWTWRLRADTVRELIVSAATTVESGAVPQVRAGAAFPGGVIKVKTEHGRLLLAGLGYPLGLLRSLADALEGDMRTVSAWSGRAGDAGVRVVEAGPVEQGVPDADLAAAPPKTDVMLQPLADGVAVSVPPAGLLRGSHGLFVFALLWNGFTTAVVAITATSIAKKHGSSDAPPLAVALIVVLFVLIGVAVLLAAIDMGRRRSLLAVTGGALTVRRIGAFRTRETRFALADVADIRVGPSGMTVNDRPILELQVHSRRGRKLGLFAERNDDELRWLAALLRQHIKQLTPLP